MPNLRTSSVAVDTATKCLGTAASSPELASSHARALRAFVSVSCVVKVLLSTMKSVCSGSTSATASDRCVPSTFDTKCARMPFFQYGASARLAMAGPRSLPPMPMFTTSVMGLPVWPFQAPLRTLSVKPRIFARTAFTSGITSLPSTRMGRLERLRSATWSTARFSVRLIFSPAIILSRHANTSACRARSNRSPRVCSVTRFLEKSTRMSSTSSENRSKRLGSSANALRMRSEPAPASR